MRYDMTLILSLGSLWFVLMKVSLILSKGTRTLYAIVIYLYKRKMQGWFDS